MSEERKSSLDSFMKKMVFGLLAAIAGLSTSVSRCSQVQSMTETTQAVVVNVETHHRRKKSDVYMVTVLFEDSDHLSHKAKSIIYWSTSPIVGDVVEIEYDPWHPDDGFLLVSDDTYVRGAYQGYLVTILIAGGIVLTVVIWRKLDTDKKANQVPGPSQQPAGLPTEAYGYVAVSDLPPEPASPDGVQDAVGSKEGTQHPTFRMSSQDGTPLARPTGADDDAWAHPEGSDCELVSPDESATIADGDGDARICDE